MNLNRTIDLVCPDCGELLQAKVRIKTVTPVRGFTEVTYREGRIDHDCEGKP